MLRNVCQSLQQRVPYFMKLYPGRAALCTVLFIFLQLVEVVSLHTSQRECFMSPPPTPHPIICIDFTQVIT